MNPEIERRLAKFVNRKAEIQRFRDMLDSEDKLIMLISGESGVGKSLLFTRLIQECELRNRKKTEVIWSDLRPHDYLAIMRKIRNDFGEDLFKPLTKLINEFTDPTLKLEISGPTSTKVAEGMTVSNHSTVRDVIGTKVEFKDLYLVNPRSDRAVPERERVADLTDLFLKTFGEALRKEPLVVFFDAMEKMSETTRKWVWGELLKAVANGQLPNVRFVLCGISHPPLDLEIQEIAEEAQLGAWGEAEIGEYLGLVGIEEQLRHDLAVLLLQFTKGKPIEVASGVLGYLRKR